MKRKRFRLNQKFIDELKSVLDESQILVNEPMSQHTSFRVGGPADLFLKPEASQIGKVIQKCQQFGMPYLILGNGSNLLVVDEGIRGIVIEMGSNLSKLSLNKNHIIVGAGTLLSSCANYAAANGLGGMEFAAGIPGSIGGAVTMNAGAYGGEMKDILKEVTVVTQEGKQCTIGIEDLHMGYRYSDIQKYNHIVVEAVLELEAKEEEAIRQLMKELSIKRTSKQPLEYPSAGSTFKRPEGFFAGKLIMDAGLSGFRVGGAMVSEKHCGFVINYDHATTKDIRNLIQQVRERVYAKHQIWLETEVKIIEQNLEIQI